MDFDAYEFAMSFTVVTCDVCGSDGFADDGRCDCGVSYEQGDDHVATRRRLVLSACGLLPPMEAPPIHDRPPAGIWTDMSTLVGSLMRSFEAIARGEESGAQLLAEAVRGLCALQEVTRSAPRLRPWCSSWRVVENVLTQIEKVAASYLMAVTAGTAPLAEAKGAEAQIALDAAGALASAYGQRLDRWSEGDNESLDPIDALSGLAAGAFHLSGARSLLEFDSLGQDLYTRITGSSEAMPGVGLQLQLTAFLASVLFDEGSFWRKSRTAHELFSHDQARLIAVAGSDRWASAMGRATAELRDVAVESAAIAAAIADARFEVRSLIRLGGRLFETIAVPLLAALLSVRRDRELSRLLGADPNTVVTQTRDAKLADLTDGLLAALRDADAHAAYAISGDRIVFTSARAEVSELTLPQLTDAVLAGLETVSALYTGLVCALGAAGIDPEETETLLGLHLSPSDKLRLALAFSGWMSLEISEDGSRLSISGQGRFPENPSTLGAVCCTFVDDHIETLELTGRDGGSEHNLAGPVASIRAWSSTEAGLVRDVLFIEAGHLWSYDGEPVFSQDHVRKWIAIKAAAAVKGRGDPHSLRLLQKLAARLEDQEMSRSLGAALRILRAKGIGIRVQQKDIAALDLLIEWERRVL